MRILRIALLLALVAGQLLVVETSGQSTANLARATLAGGHRAENNVLAFLVSESEEGASDMNGDGDSLDQVLSIHDSAAGTTVNVGLATANYALRGRDVAFVVSEAGQGLDLNGDGDLSDFVLHVYDGYTGSTTNVALAVFNGELFFRGDVVAFTVPENGQGIGDLNGDGDTNDEVLHVHRFLSGTTSNLGLQATKLGLGDDVLAFTVREGFQGDTDLNLDGDRADEVLFVYDPADGQVQNLGLALASAAAFVVRGGRVAAYVDEGLTDLNGDGDSNDSVLHTYDAASDVLWNVGLSSVVFATDGVLVLGDKHVVFPVSESSQGNVDMNGDGDTNDEVLHFHRYGIQVTTNLGLAAPSGHVVDGVLVAFLVSESQQGGADLNGDGDANDRVLHVRSMVGTTTVNVGLASDPQLVETIEISGGSVAFSVSESKQGGNDFNGDGDANDTVMHVYDAALDATTNLGLATVPFFSRHEITPRTLSFLVSEAAQGGTDLDGSGTAAENVLHVYDLVGDTVYNSTLSGSGQSIAASGDFVAFPAAETSASDWNGDLDHSDRVMFTWDLDSCTAGSVAMRNAGTNPVSFRSEPLVMGTTMRATVDLTTTGHGAALIFAFDGSTNLPLGGGQRLLVLNIASGEMLSQSAVFGPIATFDIPIVNDTILCGRTLHAQAIHFLGVAPFALSNSLDFVFGY